MLCHSCGTSQGNSTEGGMGAKRGKPDGTGFCSAGLASSSPSQRNECLPFCWQQGRTTCQEGVNGCLSPFLLLSSSWICNRPSGSAHFRSCRVQVSNARGNTAMARDRVKLPGLVLPVPTHNLQRFPHRLNLTPKLQALRRSVSINNKQQKNTNISLPASPTLQTIHPPTRRSANQTTQH